MYFVGWRGWIKVRDEYRQAKGSCLQPVGIQRSRAERRCGSVPCRWRPLLEVSRQGATKGGVKASIIYVVPAGCKITTSLFPRLPSPDPFRLGAAGFRKRLECAFLGAGTWRSRYLIAVILIVFIYQPVKVEGTSMMPTLTDQERIFINKFTYHFGLGQHRAGRYGGFLVSAGPVEILHQARDRGSR